MNNEEEKQSIQEKQESEEEVLARPSLRSQGRKSVTSKQSNQVTEVVPLRGGRGRRGKASV